MNPFQFLINNVRSAIKTVTFRELADELAEQMDSFINYSKEVKSFLKSYYDNRDVWESQIEECCSNMGNFSAAQSQALLSTYDVISAFHEGLCGMSFFLDCRIQIAPIARVLTLANYYLTREERILKGNDESSLFENYLDIEGGEKGEALEKYLNMVEDNAILVHSAKDFETYVSDTWYKISCIEEHMQNLLERYEPIVNAIKTKKEVGG